MTPVTPFALPSFGNISITEMSYFSDGIVETLDEKIREILTGCFPLSAPFTKKRVSSPMGTGFE